MRKKVAFLLVLVGIAFFLPDTRADEPVVTKQLYDISGRLQVLLSPMMTVADKYTRNVGIAASVQYYFTDWIGLDVDFGYQFISGDRKLLNEILRTSTTLENVERLPLTDLKRMTWGGQVGVILSPLYGKLNFSAELAVNIHLYFILGAGVAQYKYTELRWSAGSYTKQNVTYSGGLADSSIQPTFQFGGGVILHITQNWGLHLEIRDIFFYDDYHAQYKELEEVKEKTLKDFVHTTFLRLGVAYAF